MSHLHFPTQEDDAPMPFAKEIGFDVVDPFASAEGRQIGTYIISEPTSAEAEALAARPESELLDRIDTLAPPAGGLTVRDQLIEQ